MKIIKYICLLFVLGLPFYGLNAQMDSYTIVKLQDGSIFEGQLIEYHDGDHIVLDIGNNQISIKAENIRSIKHKYNSIQKPYGFKEKGHYHNSSLGFLPGYFSGEMSSLGVALDHSSGYLFNRWFGAGLNIGIYNYDAESMEVIYSLAAEIRGYLLEKNITPYYVLKSGYGFNFKGQRFLETNGGLFVNPGLGLRFGGNNGANFTTEIGLVFQDAYFKQQSGWWDRSVIEKDIRYQRFNLKFGILF